MTRRRRIEDPSKRPDSEAERTHGDGESGDDASPDRDRQWLSGVQSRLLEWYGTEGRDLPWREPTPDPYRILVSEMMLVQTTVTAVIPFYERFTRLFPDALTLAKAEESTVLKAWEGLGYYRRARQLHAAARAIVEVHGGTFPADPVAVRALPGVGRYMAGAILSFAFGRAEPILEANTRRVLARLVAWPHVIPSTSSEQRLWLASSRLVPQDRAGDFNQALMDLGAKICIPRKPICLVCPIRSLCRAHQAGLQDMLPRMAPRSAPLEVSEACMLVKKGNRVLIVQRGTGGLWSGFWEFPTIHLEGADPAGRSFEEPSSLADGLRKITGIHGKIGPEIHKLTFQVTKHRVRLQVYLARAISGEPEPGQGFVDVRWISPEDLDKYPFGSAGRRIATWLRDHPSQFDLP